MHPSHSKSKCIVSVVVNKAQMGSSSPVRAKYMLVSLYTYFLLLGRETSCCGEMGKHNHSHLHFIWLSCPQNHLVPMFWDTAFVSITALGGELTLGFGVSCFNSFKPSAVGPLPDCMFFRNDADATKTPQGCSWQSPCRLPQWRSSGRSTGPWRWRASSPSGPPAGG